MWAMWKMTSTKINTWNKLNKKTHLLKTRTKLKSTSPNLNNPRLLPSKSTTRTKEVMSTVLLSKKDPPRRVRSKLNGSRRKNSLLWKPRKTKDKVKPNLRTQWNSQTQEEVLTKIWKCLDSIQSQQNNSSNPPKRKRQNPSREAREARAKSRRWW